MYEGKQHRPAETTCIGFLDRLAEHLLSPAMIARSCASARARDAPLALPSAAHPSSASGAMRGPLTGHPCMQVHMANPGPLLTSQGVPTQSCTTPAFDRCALF